MYKRGGDSINNNTITFGNFSTESSKSTKKKNIY